MNFRNILFVLLFFTLLLFCKNTIAQETYIFGTVRDPQNKPIPLVNITNKKGKGTSADMAGKYKLNVIPGKKDVYYFTHQSYKKYQTDSILLNSGEYLSLDVTMIPDEKLLKEVEVKGKPKEPDHVREQVSVTKIDPKVIKIVPSVFGDFNQVLSTLPGVSVRNELSSEYAVRGGNFDENLVYVNGIEIYRPFLTHTGQQEGLSFINPDLVSDVEFSAGGFQPKYGDKLSSVLDIKYKEPRKFAGSVSTGLLGGTAHLERISQNKKFTYIAGIRQKQAQYILNALETKGDYKPSFTDFQTYLNWTLKSDTIRDQYGSIEYIKKTNLGLLTSVARNKYSVIPSARETSFGTVQKVFRLFVAFDGQEIDQFDTWQGGVIFKKDVSRNFNYSILSSGLYTSESETFDIEGGYRLCDVSNNFGGSTFNQCVFTRGVGTFFNHARNYLDARVFNLEHKGQYLQNRNNIQYGVRYSMELIKDEITEWSFVDSADYIFFHDYLKTDISLNSNRYSGFIQNSYKIDTLTTFTYGIRNSYWDVNQQLTTSPRIQFSWKPLWYKRDSSRRDIVFRTAVGYYHQPPFYRELRDKNGILNKNLKAQESVHLVLGFDSNIKMWRRPFKIYTEAYFKWMENVIPYDVDNVRIRYFASNNATAYATGTDFRIYGEFVQGVESWFSLGLLQTKEDIKGDTFTVINYNNDGTVLVTQTPELGYIRRPTDQLLTAGLFFQDYLPMNKTFKVQLNFIFATGLPFGPPGSTQYRNYFESPAYRRVDIGFSKMLSFNDKNRFKSRYLESIWLGVEVLNLLQVPNVASYIWLQDVYEQKFAIPNRLTDRLVNLRMIVKF